MNAIAYKNINGTSYHEETDAEVVNVLERARSKGERIRVFYGDVKTGECSMDEYDTIGTIGRSGGSIKVPILLANTRSTGGGPLLDHCIIRIDTRWRGAIHTLYTHPLFHFKAWRATLSDDTSSKLRSMAYLNDELVACFPTVERINRYHDFIMGKRWSK